MTEWTGWIPAGPPGGTIVYYTVGEQWERLLAGDDHQRALAHVLLCRRAYGQVKRVAHDGDR